MDNDAKFHIQELDVQACSTTDCTGLIPSAPATEEELENYAQLYPYLAKVTVSDEKPTGKLS